jgi:hypothetical protein
MVSEILLRYLSTNSLISQKQVALLQLSCQYSPSLRLVNLDVY